MNEETRGLLFVLLSFD